MAWAAGQRIMGSQDIYDPERRGHNASVNFLNCHDGFTLWDMYSYNEKHNEANGWNNTDGSNDNRSWNCGAEGETDNEEVLSLRRKLAKNAVTVLMMSRGTPMFPAGDEFLNTQYGNNNAYCQDNEISWLDWSMLEKNREHFEYTKHVIRLRKEHDVIRRFSGTCSLGWPEMRLEGPDASANVLRVIYAGRNRENTGDDLVLLAVNVYWEEQEFLVPGLPYGMGWQVEADTSGWYLRKGIPEGEKVRVLEERMRIAPRSVLVLTGGNV